MKEIISIPAGQTQDIIKKYLIHAHPHPRNYKESQYVTFRKKGGVMDSLYSIQEELVIKPKSQDTEEQLKYMNNEFRNRLLGYLYERKHTFGFEGKELYKFYILKIERLLEHLPKPMEGTVQSHT